MTEPSQQPPAGAATYFMETAASNNNGGNNSVASSTSTGAALVNAGSNHRPVYPPIIQDQQPFAAVLYPPTNEAELMLQTAANAAAAAVQQTPPAPLQNVTTNPPVDAVALAAMQEAASIVIEQQQRSLQTDQYSPAFQAYPTSRSTRSTFSRLQQQQQQQHPPLDTTSTVRNVDTTATAAAGDIKLHKNNNNKRPPPVLDAVNASVLTAGNGGVVATVTAADPPTDDQPSSPNNKKVRTATASNNRVPWDERIRQLQEYKDQFGNLLIPIRYKPHSLGKFVHNTREQYKLFHKQTPEGYKKKCSLTAARIEQLNAMGFAWTTERTKRQNDDWQRRLDQLRAFKEKHGHCLVPHGYLEDPSFAEWIHRQRTSYNSLLSKEEEEEEAGGGNGEDESSPTKEAADADAGGTTPAPAAPTVVNPMMKARFEQLKALGFNFTVHSDKWLDHWKQLQQYKEKHGDCQVPTHYAENPKLGRWVHTQRHQRRLQQKGKKSCMTQERIQMLDELGFSWEVRASLERPRATWHQRLEELQEFHKRNGNFLIDPATMPALHVWCYEQRQRLRLLDKNDGKDVSKRMSPDRVKELETLGFTKDTQLSMDHQGEEMTGLLQEQQMTGVPNLGGTAGAGAVIAAGVAMDPTSFSHMDDQALGAAMVDAALDTGTSHEDGDAPPLPAEDPDSVEI